MQYLGFSIEQWSAITNAGLTVGLLIFAGMQWWVTRASEQNRLAERADDAAVRQQVSEEEQDRAFQTIWAEHFRLEGLAESWERADLVHLAALGILRSSELLPRDWSTMVTALGRIGRESGFLGGVAIRLAHDVERQVAELKALVDGFARQYPQRSPNEVATLTRENANAACTRLEGIIRILARDLSNLVWDAARQSPRAELVRTLNFSDEMHSKFGKTAVASLQTRMVTHDPRTQSD